MLGAQVAPPPRLFKAAMFKVRSREAAALRNCRRKLREHPCRLQSPACSPMQRGPIVRHTLQSHISEGRVTKITKCKSGRSNRPAPAQETAFIWFLFASMHRSKDGFFIQMRSALCHHPFGVGELPFGPPSLFTVCIRKFPSIS